MTKRFFYNPDNKKLHVFNFSHVEFYHNNKNLFNDNFDFYIRGIIEGEKIYLRVFYPYNDIGELSYNDLLEKSFALLSLYKGDILKALKKQGIKGELIFNCTNNDLKDYLKTNFV